MLYSILKNCHILFSYLNFALNPSVNKKMLRKDIILVKLVFYNITHFYCTPAHTTITRGIQTMLVDEQSDINDLLLMVTNKFVLTLL